MDQIKVEASVKKDILFLQRENCAEVVGEDLSPVASPPRQSERGKPSIFINLQGLDVRDCLAADDPQSQGRAGHAPCLLPCERPTPYYFLHTVDKTEFSLAE